MSTHDFWVSEEFDATLTYLSALSEKLSDSERETVEAPLNELVRLRKEAISVFAPKGAHLPVRRLQ